MIKVNRGQAPVWYETAVLANKGNSIAKEIMTKTYTDAHFSEWAWAGAKFDFEIDNSGSIDNLYTDIDNIIKTIMP